MLKSIKFVTIFQILLNFLLVRAEIYCNGDNWMDQPICNVIQNSVMNFKFNSVKDLKNIKTDLSSIHHIQNGIEIEIPDLIVFEFLPNVTSIRNKDGPAIKFSNHQHFKQIKFPNLQNLSGYPIHIFFEDDQYLKLSSKRGEDLAEIYLRTQKPEDPQKCSEVFNFIDVWYHDIHVKMPLPQYYFYVVIGICIVLFLMLVGIGYRTCEVYELWQEAIKEAAAASDEENFANVLSIEAEETEEK